MVIGQTPFLSSAVLIAKAQMFGLFFLGHSLILLSFVNSPSPLPPTQVYWREMEQELRLTDDYLLAALVPKDTQNTHRAEQLHELALNLRSVKLNEC